MFALNGSRKMRIAIAGWRRDLSLLIQAIAQEVSDQRARPLETIPLNGPYTGTYHGRLVLRPSDIPKGIHHIEEEATVGNGYEADEMALRHAINRIIDRATE